MAGAELEQDFHGSLSLEERYDDRRAKKGVVQIPLRRG